MPTLLRTVVVVIAVLGSAARVGAEPIRVVAGSLSIDTGDPPSFTLFTADGRSYVGEGFASNWDPSCFYQCPAGASIALSIAPGGPDGFGFLGRDDGVNGFPVIRFNFSAPEVTLPIDITGTAHERIFHVPFTFAGQLSAFPTIDLSGEPLFAAALTGRGIAKLNMFVEGGLYTFSSLDYDFKATDPIPEPGTMFLVSAGGALLWRCRRRAAPAVGRS
jgi:PEP-CTERM motif-containing protein